MTSALPAMSINTHDDRWMNVAVAEAALARGTTGDNPWVGCVIVDTNNALIGRGHTRGPGEDHAEIAALGDADARGSDVRGTTMFSTLEPCSFHGRTPACSRVIIDRGIARVVVGMLDPNPRVDGEGLRILRDAGLEVTAFVCEREVRRQLGAWVIAFHRHEPVRRARAIASQLSRRSLVAWLEDLYAIDAREAETIANAL